MTEPHDDLTDALHRLRGEIRAQVPVPAAAGLRARALHQLRVRRATTAVLATAAVGVVALGGTTLLQPTATPPTAPPASPPAVTVTPSPAVPSQLPLITPSPRPAPGPVPAPPDDPIAQVDWRAATIDLPAHPGCPSGPVTFIAVSDAFQTAVGPAEGFPQIFLDAVEAGYGDLTGDGRVEAVVRATCRGSEEDSGDGEGQLLVVARELDGALRGIAWVGPRGAVYHSQWVVDGDLYLEAHPHVDLFAWQPGVALRYRWDGAGFTGPEWAPEYPAIMPPAGEDFSAPVRLGAVAGGLGCPDGTVRFDHAGEARVGEASFYLDLAYPPGSGPYLIDLDSTGDRLLVAAVRCEPAGKRGLAVFAPAGDGFEGISVLVLPEGYEVGGWSTEIDPPGHPGGTGSRRLVFVELSPADGGVSEPRTYRWTGTVLEPVDE